MRNDCLECTIHNFKTHVSRYIRLLEAGQYKAMIVKRHSTPVGIFFLLNDLQRNAAARSGPPDGAM